MAGIDRRPAGSQQRQQRRLRPLQLEGHLVIAVRSHLFDVAVPGLARIDAKLLARLAGQKVPGALDVLGREGLAVVPFDALARREPQLGALLVPRPAGGQIRDDRLQAGLWHVLLVHDEVVENTHHRPLRRACRFFEDRHARRAVEVRESEDAPLPLGECRLSGEHCKNQRARCRESSQILLHLLYLPWFSRARRAHLATANPSETRRRILLSRLIAELSFKMPTRCSLSQIERKGQDGAPKRSGPWSTRLSPPRRH